MVWKKICKVDWMLIPKKNIQIWETNVRLIRTPSGWERQSRGTFESCTWAKRWAWGSSPLNLQLKRSTVLRCELYEPMQRLDAGNIDNYFIIATRCQKKDLGPGCSKKESLGVSIFVCSCFGLDQKHLKTSHDDDTRWVRIWSWTQRPRQLLSHDWCVSMICGPGRYPWPGKGEAH